MNGWHSAMQYSIVSSTKMRYDVCMCVYVFLREVKAHARFIHLHMVHIDLCASEKPTIHAITGAPHIWRLLSIVPMVASTPFICCKSDIHPSAWNNKCKHITVQMGYIVSRVYCVQCILCYNQQILYSENHNEINSDKMYSLNVTEDEQRTQQRKSDENKTRKK